MKITTTLLLIILMMHFPSFSQDDPFQPVIRALQDSDSRKLSTHFNTAVDLGLSGKENSYSISQAEMIMRDFFRKFPADSFTVTRKGAADAVSYHIIGDYRSGAAVFQVYLLLREVNGKQLIHKIKFEDKPAIPPSKHDN
ncbi:MAG: DUF4783 domain-containing protein [Bacteroidales bacterium]|nr:DUF4783 domain-containing protein [Bacteroidales bacterium]